MGHRHRWQSTRPGSGHIVVRAHQVIDRVVGYTRGCARRRGAAARGPWTSADRAYRSLGPAFYQELNACYAKCNIAHNHCIFKGYFYECSSFFTIVRMSRCAGLFWTWMNTDTSHLPACGSTVLSVFCISFSSHGTKTIYNTSYTLPRGRALAAAPCSLLLFVFSLAERKNEQQVERISTLLPQAHLLLRCRLRIWGRQELNNPWS